MNQHGGAPMQWDSIEPILNARTWEDLATVTEHFGRNAGFENFGYAAGFQNIPGMKKQNAFRTFHNHVNEWGASYNGLRSPTAVRGDARAMLGRSGLPALAWNSHGKVSYEVPVPLLLRMGRRQAMMAGEFHMRSGIVVPCWSRGVDWGFLAFSTDGTGDLRAINEHIPSLVYFANCLQAAIDHLAHKTCSFPNLTEREREVLCWSAVGKTSWESSVILGISERTVNFHLQRAAAKLQVKGGRAACARAVALGLISL